MLPRRSAALLALLSVLATGLAAQAALSDAVVAAFRGKLVLTRAAVPEGASDKESIAKLKAAQLTEIAGAATDDGQTWRFHYTAFLKTVGNVGLKVRYVSGEQDRRLAAETAIPIPDVASPVLSGDLTIGESQGLVRGKAYLLQVVNDKGEIVAKTSAVFK